MAIDVNHLIQLWTPPWRFLSGTRALEKQYQLVLDNYNRNADCITLNPLHSYFKQNND